MIDNWRRRAGGLRRPGDIRLCFNGVLGGAFEAVGGVFSCGGGLQRRQRQTQDAMDWRGAEGDFAGWRTGDSGCLISDVERRQRATSIACVNGKEGNRFKMCMSALRDPFASVK